MKPSHNSRQKVGKLGEDIAASYLVSHGFVILERNFRVRYGELDIVAYDGDTLVFVEVKTRSSNMFGTPEEAVTPRKLRDVLRAASQYVHDRLRTEPPMRIDVVAVYTGGTAPEIRHLRDVTS